MAKIPGVNFHPFRTSCFWIHTEYESVFSVDSSGSNIFFSLTENRVPFCRFFKAYLAASWTKLKIRLYSSVTVKFTVQNADFSSHKRFVVSSEHYVWSHLYSCAPFTRWSRILYCNFLTHSLAVHKKRWWNEVFLARFLLLSKNKITLWICTSHVLFGLIQCTPNGFDDFQWFLLTSSMSIFQSQQFSM